MILGLRRSRRLYTGGHARLRRRTADWLTLIVAPGSTPQQATPIFQITFLGVVASRVRNSTHEGWSPGGRGVYLAHRLVGRRAVLTGAWRESPARRGRRGRSGHLPRHALHVPAVRVTGRRDGAQKLL